jgi:hypothetical protein
MGVTSTSSGVTGVLARDGRLTRGGMTAVGGCGLLLLTIVAAEWRALTTAAFGVRTAGTVVEVADASDNQQDYAARVRFASGNGELVITRPLHEPGGNGSRPRLRVGDDVPVAYRRGEPLRAVLLHPHENFAAAPWTSIAGIGLMVVAWIWRPRPRVAESTRRS